MSNIPPWLQHKIAARYPDAKRELMKFAEWIVTELVQLDLVEGPPKRESLPPELAKYHRFRDVERMYYFDLMKACDGRVTRAAKLSGMPRCTIYNKIKEFKLHDLLLTVRRKQPDYNKLYKG